MFTFDGYTVRSDSLFSVKINTFGLVYTDASNRIMPVPCEDTLKSVAIYAFAIKEEEWIEPGMTVEAKLALLKNIREALESTGRTVIVVHTHYTELEDGSIVVRDK